MVGAGVGAGLGHEVGAELGTNVGEGLGKAVGDGDGKKLGVSVGGGVQLGQLARLSTCTTPHDVDSHRVLLKALYRSTPFFITHQSLRSWLKAEAWTNIRFTSVTLWTCPVPLTVRGTQALVSFAPLAFKLFYAARHNAVLRRSSFPSP